MHYEFVSQGQTLNQHLHKKVLTGLVNIIRQKRRVLWASKTLILHRDNAPAHTSLSVKQFLVSKQITKLNHPPYSPGLAPCDFFLFPKLKGKIKGTRLKGIDDIKTNVTAHVKFIEKREFKECFRSWS